MSEHSKGPWTAEEPFQRDGRWASNVRVGAYDGESGPGNTICIVYLGGPGATCGEPAAIKANARLIAASPELVEAYGDDLAGLSLAVLLDDVAFVLSGFGQHSLSERCRAKAKQVRSALEKAGVKS